MNFNEYEYPYVDWVGIFLGTLMAAFFIVTLFLIAKIQPKPTTNNNSPTLDICVVSSNDMVTHQIKFEKPITLNDCDILRKFSSTLPSSAFTEEK